MRRKAAVLAVLLLATTLYAATPRKVMSVTHVTAVRRGNAIYTVALGDVPTGGWKNPRLTQPTVRNGILTYQFVAVKPTGIVPQVITEVQAEAVRRGNIDRIQKVRVNAANNSMTVDVK